MKCSERETFLRSFCFCKKNQKARATCFLGRGRRPDAPKNAAQRHPCCDSNKDIRRRRQGLNLVCVIPPCGVLIRGLQNLESPQRNVFTFFSLLRKERGVAEGPRPSRLPENGSKLYRLCFFVTFPALVPKPVYGATHFFGCFEPVRKGYCSADARLIFFENRMLYSKLTGANVF